MERMDWGDAEDFVSFGTVSADQIDDSQYYILIAPQNVVGSTIMTNLHDMVGACVPLSLFAGQAVKSVGKTSSTSRFVFACFMDARRIHEGFMLSCTTLWTFA